MELPRKINTTKKNISPNVVLNILIDIKKKEVELRNKMLSW